MAASLVVGGRLVGVLHSQHWHAVVVADRSGRTVSCLGGVRNDAVASQGWIGLC